MTRYVILTAPLSVADAEGLARALGKYKISVADLAVWHVWRDGSRHRDIPTARTMTDIIGSATAAIALTPAAIPLLGLFPISLPALVVTLIAEIKALHSINRSLLDPRAVGSEIHFSFSNVSEKRRLWAEYLIGAYCQLHSWRLLGAGKSAKSGMSYAIRNRRLPPAFEERQKR